MSTNPPQKPQGDANQPAPSNSIFPKASQPFGSFPADKTSLFNKANNEGVAFGSSLFPSQPKDGQKKPTSLFGSLSGTPILPGGSLFPKKSQKPADASDKDKSEEKKPSNPGQSFNSFSFMGTAKPGLAPNPIFGANKPETKESTQKDQAQQDVSASQAQSISDEKSGSREEKKLGLFANMTSNFGSFNSNTPLFPPAKPKQSDEAPKKETGVPQPASSNSLGFPSNLFPSMAPKAPPSPKAVDKEIKLSSQISFGLQTKDKQKPVGSGPRGVSSVANANPASATDEKNPERPAAEPEQSQPKPAGTRKIQFTDSEIMEGASQKSFEAPAKQLDVKKSEVKSLFPKSTSGQMFQNEQAKDAKSDKNAWGMQSMHSNKQTGLEGAGMPNKQVGSIKGRDGAKEVGENILGETRKQGISEGAQNVNRSSHEPQRAGKCLYLEQVQNLINFGSKRQIEKNIDEIAKCFIDYLSIEKNEEKSQLYENPRAFFSKRNIEDQKINHFLNDAILTLRPLLHIHESAFPLLKASFKAMLKEYNFDKKLFEGQEMTAAAKRFYKISDFTEPVLLWENNQLGQVMGQFISYITYHLTKCLKLIRNPFHKGVFDLMFNRSKIFQNLIESACLISLRKPNTSNKALFTTVKQADDVLLAELVQVIEYFNKGEKTRLSLSALESLVPTFDQLHSDQILQMVQKIILTSIDLSRSKKDLSSKLLDAIERTISPGLLPFRVILPFFDGKRKKIKPFASKLFKHVRGPQWFDWLEVYLKKNRYERDALTVVDDQIPYIIKALSSMKLDSTSKLFRSTDCQIFKLIRGLREENKKYFYEIVCAIMNDEEAVNTIEEQFKLGGDEIFTELRQLTSEISKFPSCSFEEEDILQLHSKAVYFLTNLKLIPERAFDFEKELFQVLGFSEGTRVRCDRVCHLVLDMLAYFSAQDFDETIVIQAFQVIIALLGNNNTREWMSLAMNINKPSLSFFNRNLSNGLVATVQKFMMFVLNSEEFYDSVRSVDKSFILSKAYPFRYQVEKNYQLTNDLDFSIPPYWFASCLKMLVCQGYNPLLLDSILSKLRIEPTSTEYTCKLPLLQAIVDACNSSSFWKQLVDTLEPSTKYVGDRCVLKNELMVVGAASGIKVYSSLKLANTIIQLIRIRRKGQKYMRHFITHLLSNLRCLGEAERYLFQFNQTFTQSKQWPHTLRLIALLGEQTYVTNDSAYLSIEWNIQDYEQFDSTLVREHERIGNTADYYVIRDLLVHPLNKYLDCVEGVASLALKCLTNILTESQDIVLESALYAVSSRQDISSEKSFADLKGQMIESLVEALESPVNSLCRAAWEFIVVLRKHQNNSRLSREIFTSYKNKKRSSIQNPACLKLFSEYLAVEAKEGYFQNDRMFDEAIHTLQKQKTPNFNHIIRDYERLSHNRSSVGQFARLAKERQLMEHVDLLDQVAALIEFALRSIFKGNVLAEKATSAVAGIIASKGLLSLISEQSEPKLPLGLPRTFERDALEIFLTDLKSTRVGLIEMQVANVGNWCRAKVGLLNQTIRNFFLVVLSIDHTYYANHPLPIQNYKNNSISCQLHIKPTGNSAINLMGGRQPQALALVKKCLDDSIEKAKELREFGLTQEMLSCLKLIDSLVSWLRCQLGDKRAHEAEIKSIGLNVLTVCLPWFSGAIVDSTVAKLFLTLVICTHGRLSEQMQLIIRDTISKTLSSVETTPETKQQMLSLLTLIPPLPFEAKLVQSVVGLWVAESNNEFFYNISRVVLKLCERYPIQMAGTKLLSKAYKIRNLNEGCYSRERYFNGMRKPEVNIWIWCMKIASALVEHGGNSTLVLHQVSGLIQENKKRIVFTLNEPRLVMEENKRIKRDGAFEMTLAHLEEVEATLELLANVSMKQMWVSAHRQIFEEFLYLLMHRTILMFVESSMGTQLRKRYTPCSDNEKIMWSMHCKEPLTIAEQAYNEDEGLYSQSPSIFMLTMSLKFQACLKAWALACSCGMRKSCFAREYFSKPITYDANGLALKYSLTHWEHLNRAICELMEKQGRHALEWGKWEKRNEMLSLLTDIFKSGELFTQSGYLSALQGYPQNEEEMFQELVECIGLLLEMGACHLVSQISFQSNKGSISKESISLFREKISKLSEAGKEKLGRTRLDLGEFEAIAIGRDFLNEAQLVA